MIELVVAVAVLTIGILGMFMGFISAQKLNLVNERHATLVHIAQQQIEQIEGVPYSQVGLISAPSPSTDPANPDYYVTAGSPPGFKWDRTTNSSESLDVDPPPTGTGAVQPVKSWTAGVLGGQVYSFVTWTADPKCGPGCPSTNDYKRITVAVTLGGGLQPTPVWVSSVVADPQATPKGGVSNGNTNPLANPATNCPSGPGGLCTSPIDSGNPNTFFLHDWPATNTSTPLLPSANNPTHPTVGVVGLLTCTISQVTALLGLQLGGCPTPDLMDSNPPSGSQTGPLYNYSTDQGTTGSGTYPGGRLLQPTCALGLLCSGSSGGGTGSTSDCNGGGWASNLLNVQSEFWVSSPVTVSETLTGDAGISMFTQTLGGAQAVISYCIEIYDVPPDGSPGSLMDILAWPPVALGGAGYVAATDPSTGGNWPTGTSGVSFIFNFRGSNGAVTIAPGHRIGVRVWIKANLNTAIDLIYDHPQFPAQVQLNTQ